MFSSTVDLHKTKRKFRVTRRRHRYSNYETNRLYAINTALFIKLRSLAENNKTYAENIEGPIDTVLRDSV